MAKTSYLYKVQASLYANIQLKGSVHEAGNSTYLVLAPPPPPLAKLRFLLATQSLAYARACETYHFATVKFMFSLPAPANKRTVHATVIFT